MNKKLPTKNIILKSEKTERDSVVNILMKQIKKAQKDIKKEKLYSQEKVIKEFL